MDSQLVKDAISLQSILEKFPNWSSQVLSSSLLVPLGPDTPGGFAPTKSSTMSCVIFRGSLVGNLVYGLKTTSGGVPRFVGFCSRGCFDSNTSRICYLVFVQVSSECKTPPPLRLVSFCHVAQIRPERRLSLKAQKASSSVLWVVDQTGDEPGQQGCQLEDHTALHPNG